MNSTKRPKLNLMGVVIPTLIALLSMVLSVQTWWNQQAREFELSRPLASLGVDSLKAADGLALFQLEIENQGELTFIIRDIHLRLKAQQTLEPIWTDCSLIQPGAALPLGMSRFQLSGEEGGRGALYNFGGQSDAWHIVDPGRRVQLPFTLPLRGRGLMVIIAEVYLQGVRLGSIKEEILRPATVNGKTLQVVPESGVGQLSDLPIYPFTCVHHSIFELN